MVKKWIIYILSSIGIMCVIVFLNVITPEDRLIEMKIGDFIMKSIGYIAVSITLIEIIFNKTK